MALIFWLLMNIKCEKKALWLVSSRFGQRVYNHVKRMEKSEYIILLERFLKGETTHDEERILVDWFKSDVSRDELRNYIQRKWEIASNSSIPTDLKERMFRKITKSY